MKWPFARAKAPEKAPAGPRTMADFLKDAEDEIDAQIASDPAWFLKLPYKGAMSQEQARRFEVEKRAMWRRVIHDAGRSDIWGLAWSTRGDILVCPVCRGRQDKRFAKAQLPELAALEVHLGCRCELLPVRS